MSPRRNKGKQKKDEDDDDVVEAALVAQTTETTQVVRKDKQPDVVVDKEVEETTTTTSNTRVGRARTRSRSLSVASESSKGRGEGNEKATTTTRTRSRSLSVASAASAASLSSTTSKNKNSKNKKAKTTSNKEETKKQQQEETKTPTEKGVGSKKKKGGGGNGNSNNKDKHQQQQQEENPSKKKNKKQQQQSPNPNSKPKPPKPIFHANVHRIRDINYIPKPIVCMASYNPPLTGTGTGTSSSSDAGNNASSSSSYIALGRENGCMELMACTKIINSSSTPSTLLYTIGNVPGSIHLKPNIIQWITTTTNTSSNRSLPVCVVGSIDGTIYVVNFESKQITSRITCNGGSIYNITTLQSNCTNLHLPIIAVACHDGSIRIYQVMIGDDGIEDIGGDPYFELLTTLPSASSAVLCLSCTTLIKTTAAKSAGSTSTTTYETALFAGVADGTIRRYNMSVSSKTDSSSSSNPTITISNISPTIRMTCESQGRQFTTTKVWCMEAWNDADESTASIGTRENVTLVTGNSIGRIEIWDGSNGTLQQSIKHNENSADVLCLSVSLAKDTSGGVAAAGAGMKHRIFGSGVDSRVVCIERESRMSGSSSTPSSMVWKLTQAQRPHTHDVNAMAICNIISDQGDNNGNYLNKVLVTGGVDTKICSYYVTEFAKHRPKIIYPWPNGNMLGTTPIRGIGSCVGSSRNGDPPAANDRLLLVQRDVSVDLFQLLSKLDIKAIFKKQKTKFKNYNKNKKGQDAEQPKEDQNQNRGGPAVRSYSQLLGSIELTSSLSAEGDDNENTASSALSTNIVSSCVSKNGQWIAICDAITSCALYELVLEKDDDEDGDGQMYYKPRRFQLPSEFLEQNLSIVSLKFVNCKTTSGEGGRYTHTLVAVDSTGQAHMINLITSITSSSIGEDDEEGSSNSETATGRATTVEYYKLFMPHAVAKNTDNDGDTIMGSSPAPKYTWPRLPIHDVISTYGKHLEGEDDSQTSCWMATLRHTSHHSIEIYQQVRNESNGSFVYRHYWTLPTLGSGGKIADRPTSMCFLKLSGKEKSKSILCLAVATASSRVYIFDVQSQKLHPWSEEQMHSKQQLPCLPMDAVINHHDFCKEYPIRLTVNPSDQSKLIVVRFSNDVLFLDLIVLHAARNRARKVISGMALANSNCNSAMLACHPCDMKVMIAQFSPDQIFPTFGWYSNGPHSCNLNDISQPLS